MANIYKSLTELIGGTPLLEVTNYEKKHKLNAKILAKLEYFNPAGSVKDRVAKAMIEDAEAKGQLKEGSVIIEPTSGNTGIGLAAVGTARGYRVILTMPETTPDYIFEIHTRPYLGAGSSRDRGRQQSRQHSHDDETIFGQM